LKRTWLPDPFPGVTGPGVENAIRIGFRHIDCAFIYQNEDEVGEAIENVLKEGVVKREDLFITSKLWGCYHHPDDVETACRESLQRLRLEYVDLFLIHTPFAIQRGEMFASETTALGYDENSINETWKAMEKLVPLGLAKSIGVSNFTITKLEALLPNTTICPAVNQIESNPQFVQSKLREYCKKKGNVHVYVSVLPHKMKYWREEKFHFKFGDWQYFTRSPI
jgi:aldehyde reductase